MYKAQVNVVGSTLQSDLGFMRFNGVAPTEGWTWTGLEIQLPETAILVSSKYLHVESHRVRLSSTI